MPERYLGPNEISRIRRFRPIYEKAASIVGWLPWTALPPIHYRENDLLERSQTVGGAFQLDPGGPGDDLRKAIDEYVEIVGRLYSITLGNIETDFETAAIVGAHELKTKLRSPALIRPPLIDAGVDEAELARGYLRYNGLGAKLTAPDGTTYRYYSERGQTGSGNPEASPDWSPYVANDPHSGRVLTMRATQPDPSDPSKRISIQRPDRRPGAIIIFREILARAAELG